jgi:hypothetical protein
MMALIDDTEILKIWPFLVQPELCATIADVLLIEVRCAL